MRTQSLLGKSDSAESWALRSVSGEEYVVQIGFPRDWTSRSRQQHEAPIPVFYLTDGNSVFLSALESMHRHLCMRSPETQGIVVAIGYSIPADSRFLMSARRTRDFTPPAHGAAGHEGGADVFLSFLQNKVKHLVARRLDETRGATVGREALFGHSYGGLLSLHALFTRTDMFHCILASSPSIWWNESYILTEEKLFQEGIECQKNSPSLMLFVGDEEQNPTRRRGEGDEEYNRRLRRHRGLQMVDNVITMHSRLKGSARLERLAIRVYD
ncbi:Alpha/Beta hydrolase protein [Colletotrichum acutatum]|uniref:Alpha/Beta hydrolase protein n=1 Tax=Glomerella acutata TaxID=27357 RepID=A0AAD8XAI5_GLOAC|nr:Alpha/Beta hydrolase protein [Colletotrichum acutatum]KAK1711618.1 Alpha/Beta hydrolase protein [Colletotrichum acutatum]